MLIGFDKNMNNAIAIKTKIRLMKFINSGLTFHFDNIYTNGVLKYLEIINKKAISFFLFFRLSWWIFLILFISIILTFINT